MGASEVLMSGEPREQSGLHAPGWVLVSFKSFVRLCPCASFLWGSLGKEIQILVGCPGGQISVFSQPYRKGHTRGQTSQYNSGRD